MYYNTRNFLIGITIILAVFLLKYLKDNFTFKYSKTIDEDGYKTININIESKNI